ncbi:MAG TPA: hypothetical protein EYH08_02075 [Pyrodictium sp.]|nr:hypothetical protein [Pyrodictium sp.]
MILEEVYMENVLSHKETRLKLEPGITVIVGPNGAGKTSIIDAITYALFSIHSRDPRKKEPLIRLGAPRAYIRVCFRLGSRKYIVERIINRAGASDARLYEVDEQNSRRLIAYGVKNVELEIRKLTGIDASLARFSMIARQGEIDLILYDKNKRIDMLNTLLGLNAIEKAYERIKYLVKEIENRRNLIINDISHLENEVQRLRKEVEVKPQLQSQLAKITQKLLEKKQLLSELEEKLQHLRTLHEEYISLSNRREMLEKELAEVENEIREVEDELRDIESQINAIMEKYGSIEEVKSKVEVAKRVRVLLEKKSMLEREIANIANFIRKYRGRVVEVKELEELMRRRRLLYDQLTRLSNRVAEYETIKKRLTDLDREISRLREEKERAIARIVAIVEQALNRRNIALRDPQRLLSALQQLEAKSKSVLEKLEKDFDRLNSEVGAIRSQLDEVSKQLELLTRASGRCPLCGRPLDAEHRMKLIKQLRAKKLELEAKLSKLIEKKERLKKDMEFVKSVLEGSSKARSKVEEMVSYIRTLDEKLRVVEREKQELQNKLLELLAAVKEYDALRDEIGKVEERIKQLEHLQELATKIKVEEERLNKLKEELIHTEQMLEEALAGYSLNEIVYIVENLEEFEKVISEYDRLMVEKKQLEKRLANLKSKYEQKVVELEEVVDRLRSLEFSEEEFRNVDKRVKEVRREIEDLIKEQAMLEERLRKVEEDEKKLQDCEKLVEEKRKMLAKINKAYSDLKRIQKVLEPGGLPRLIRLKAKKIIEMLMQQFIMRFGVDALGVELDSEYNVYLLTRDGKKSVTMLSGGERIALALAFRLAIARALGGKLGVLILDEPTVHLDEERRRELVEILRQGPKLLGVNQMIVVTHDRELEEAADTVVEVVKESGISRVVVREPSQQTSQFLPA